MSSTNKQQTKTLFEQQSDVEQIAFPDYISPMAGGTKPLVGSPATPTPNATQNLFDYTPLPNNPTSQSLDSLEPGTFGQPRLTEKLPPITPALPKLTTTTALRQPATS